MNGPIQHKIVAPFDWVNFFITLTLALIGLLFIFSTTTTPERLYSLCFMKQALGIVIGLILYFLCALTPLNKIIGWGAFLYVGVLFFLVYTMVAGWIGMGAARWVNFYFFRAQPSEAAKIFCPLFLGYYFEEVQRYTLYHDFYQRLRYYVFPLTVIFMSAFLIIKQPDLGTGLLLLSSTLLALWVMGLSRRFFYLLFFSCVIASPILWHCLKNYQKTRILVLLGYGDVRHERYQVEQSIIAIGSGGLTGKGFLKGTQSQLDFLPEDHTDFIFSVICEEWGFCGACFVLLCYVMLITRLLLRVRLLASPIDRFIFCCLTAHIALSVCINTGMVMGLLPVVGIPFPLISYGLSNLLITFSSLGWLNNYQQTVRISSRDEQ